jgi:tetratricopeptide (TPR) repeat protein
MKKARPWLIAVLFLPLALQAQFYTLTEDSLVKMLRTNLVSLSTKKIDAYTELLNRRLPETPPFDSLRNSMIEEAEGSRNRALMCYTYNIIAASYMAYFQKPEFYEKGRAYATKCIQIANESGLNEYKVAAWLQMAKYHLNLSQHQKALDYNNQAIALASTLGSDSLMSLAYASIAVTWGQMANKLSSFQALLDEREFAEKSRIHLLMVTSYYDLGAFYEDAGDYEKAKDFYTQCIRDGGTWSEYMHVFLAMRGLARTYISQNNEKLGLQYYDKALRLADSLRIKRVSLAVYLDILNYYFNTSDPSRGFTYFNNHPELLEFIRQYRIEYQMNKLYAALQSSKKHYDSALYYLRLAAPFELGQQNNYREKYNFSQQMAATYQSLKNYREEKAYLLKAKAYADSSQDLFEMKEAAQNLDSACRALGDFKAARSYLAEYNFYRDSIESLGKQKDLLNIEIENANKRAEQQKLKEEESMRVRNNLEYMGITAALATVFIVLVLLGVFKISPAVIKAMGFFAFIFLFEFIVLLLDAQIEAVTKGEPWKVLGVKIFIIALLLPLHHWLEEKMLHYLTFKAHRIRSRFTPRKLADEKE